MIRKPAFRREKKRFRKSIKVLHALYNGNAAISNATINARVRCRYSDDTSYQKLDLNGRVEIF